VVVVLGGELLLVFDGIEYGVALSGAMDVVRNGEWQAAQGAMTVLTVVEGTGLD
jgi:hypothetical protein